VSIDVKHYQVPAGSLLRLREPVWCPRLRGGARLLPAGTVVMLVEHPYPAMLRVLFGEEQVEFDFRGAVPIHGYLHELELLAAPAGERLQKWGHFRGE
jgi:hypothetical protein